MKKKHLNALIGNATDADRTSAAGRVLLFTIGIWTLFVPNFYQTQLLSSLITSDTDVLCR
jgi:hypothetical protein